MENKDTQQQQPSTQTAQQNASTDTSIAKNPDPRANENLSQEDRKEGDANDVGSEITDGEDA